MTVIVIETPRNEPHLVRQAEASMTVSDRPARARLFAVASFQTGWMIATKVRPFCAFRGLSVAGSGLDHLRGGQPHPLQASTPASAIQLADHGPHISLHSAQHPRPVETSQDWRQIGGYACGARED